MHLILYLNIPTRHYYIIKQVRRSPVGECAYKLSPGFCYEYPIWMMNVYFVGIIGARPSQRHDTHIPSHSSSNDISCTHLWYHACNMYNTYGYEQIKSCWDLTNDTAATFTALVVPELNFICWRTYVYKVSEHILLNPKTFCS